MTLVAQKLKDLSEIVEDDEGLVQMALQKRKVASPKAFAPKKAKNAQSVIKAWASVIPSTIPRCIKMRVTEANPKMGDNEMGVSFIGNKEHLTFSSSNSESTGDTPTLPPHKHALST